LAGSQSIEDKVRRAAPGQHSQSDDGSDEEGDAEKTTEKLKRVEKLPEPQVEHKGDQNQSPHDQSRMSRLWLIGLVVEYSEGGNDVGNDCRRSCTVDDPGKHSQPS